MNLKDLALASKTYILDVQKKSSLLQKIACNIKFFDIFGAAHTNLIYFHQ